MSTRLDVSKAKDDDNETKDSVESTDFFTIFQKDKQGKTYEIYFSEYVESNYDYVKLLHFLRNVSSNDTIFIYLANYGGDMHSGFQLADAILGCDGQVIIVTTSRCYSMASILALCGDLLVMNPASVLMFHNYSGIEGGKGKELMDAVVDFDTYSKNQLQRICYPFLTKKELQKIANDEDVYIWPDDVETKKRILRHFGEDKKQMLETIGGTIL